MVTRTRLRSILTGLALYAMAALMIGYFGINAYSGKYGLRARQNLDAEIARLTDEFNNVRAERVALEHKTALLQADRLDPDFLDERARAQLDYVHPRDMIVMLPKQP